MKKDVLVFILIFIVSFFTLKDLWIPNMYTSHDGAHQVVRLYYWDQAIRDGQIPPRWINGLSNGYGYPLFIFSYQAPWMIAEPFMILGIPLFLSLKITFFLTFVLSGFTIYIFEKRLFGRFAGLVATAIYLFAPYRFANIFVRASIGDATAFIFIPLLFIALHNIVGKSKFDYKAVALGSLSFAALLLSHAMVFFLVGLSMALFTLYFLFFAKNKKIFILNIIFIALLGSLISSYYLIPSIIERNYTQFSEIFQSVFAANTFLSLKELIYTPWGYGVLGSAEGAMSLQIGFAQIGSFLIAVALIILNFFRKKKIFDTSQIKIAAFYILLFIFSIFMTQKSSLVVWTLINRFIIIDFTWRILPLAVLAASVLAGFIVSRGRYRYILAVFIVSLSLYANRNHIHINQSLDWQVPFFLKLEKTTNSYDEYTPKWATKDKLEIPHTPLNFIQGNGKYTLLSSDTYSLQAAIETSQSAKIRINTIYFPGWTVAVNQLPQPVDYTSGFMDVGIPKGSSQLKAQFTQTPLNKFSNILTLIGLLTAVIFIFKKDSRQNKSYNRNKD